MLANVCHSKCSVLGFFTADFLSTNFTFIYISIFILLVFPAKVEKEKSRFHILYTLGTAAQMCTQRKIREGEEMLSKSFSFQIV